MKDWETFGPACLPHFNEVSNSIEGCRSDALDVQQTLDAWKWAIGFSIEDYRFRSDRSNTRQGLQSHRVG